MREALSSSTISSTRSMYGRPGHEVGGLRTSVIDTFGL